MRRETEAIASLLKDTARRSKQAETSKEGEPSKPSLHPVLIILALGLVIMEATYGCVEKDDGAKDLTLDVVIPLQALVRNSQLYVPADHTKVWDPIASAFQRPCNNLSFDSQAYRVSATLPLSRTKSCMFATFSAAEFITLKFRMIPPWFYP